MPKRNYQPGQQYLVRSDGGAGWGLDGGAAVVQGLDGVVAAGQGPDGEGDVVQGLQGGGCQLGSGDTPSPRVTRQ